jgi:hypothetical protein
MGKKKLTSDNINVTYNSDSWMPSDGITMMGSSGTVDSMDPDGLTYSFGDLGQLDLFSEEDMRGKYPALKQAWEHYQSVLEVCKTKEKEDDEN